MSGTGPSGAQNSAGAPDGFESFLAGFRQTLPPASSALCDLFDVFANEARFARAWLDPELSGLRVGSRILEVGAGTMLLSSGLQREGFQVTALEPIGVGFSAFEELQARVLEYSRAAGCEPSLLRIEAEQLAVHDTFPLAFSFNVMEHVNDVDVAIACIVDSLSKGGSYVFTCPNYWFPYEPHLNLPTLFSKALTERALRTAIRTSKRVPDPLVTWQSLNWINVGVIRRAVHRIQGADVRFRRDSLVRALERTRRDPVFAGRRSGWITSLIRLVVRAGFHRLAVLVPVSMQPTIDCRIRVVER